MIRDKKKILNSLFYGFAAGIITPFRFGEYLARNISLQSSTIKVAVATFFDKIFNLIIILLAGSFLAILLLFYLHHKFIALILLLVLISLTTLFVLLISNSRLRSYMINFSLIKKNAFFLKIGLDEYTKLKPEFYFKIIFLSLVHYLIVIIQYVFILKSFNASNNFFYLMWYSSLVLLGKSVIPPISFGEIGIREASSIFFASFFRISNSVGFNSSIIIFIINLLIPAVFGMLFTLRDKQ